MTQTTDRPQHDEVHEVDLAITGMTCASCSAVTSARTRVPSST